MIYGYGYSAILRMDYRIPFGAYRYVWTFSARTRSTPARWSITVSPRSHVSRWIPLYVARSDSWFPAAFYVASRVTLPLRCAFSCTTFHSRAVTTHCLLHLPRRLFAHFPIYLLHLPSWILPFPTPTHRYRISVYAVTAVPVPLHTLPDHTTLYLRSLLPLRVTFHTCSFRSLPLRSRFVICVHLPTVTAPLSLAHA